MMINYENDQTYQYLGTNSCDDMILNLIQMTKDSILKKCYCMWKVNEWSFLKGLKL